MYLGHKVDTGLFFRGNHFETVQYINPQICFLPVYSITSGTENFIPKGHRNIIFQELDFDPIRNIRRGFLWQREIMRPNTAFYGINPTWDVHVYSSSNVQHLLKDQSLKSDINLFFGADLPKSVGQLLHLEQTTDHCQLLTIQMRKQFGLLPELDESKFKDKIKYKLTIESIEKVIEGYRSSPPESVIDRCREAASVILSSKTTQKKLDLAKQINALKALTKSSNNDGVTAASCAAEIINRFHSRGKLSSREEHGTSTPSDFDAELSINLLGFLILELQLSF